MHEQRATVLERPTMQAIITRNKYLHDTTARSMRRIIGPFPLTPEEQHTFPEKSGPFEITIATTPTEIEEQFKLRYESYQANEYLNPDHHWPEPYEYDEYDIDAALFIARNTLTGKLHGAGRLAFDTQGALPLDEYYPLDAWRERIGYNTRDDITIVEFSRLISHPIHQKNLNKSLVRYIFEWAVHENVTHIVGFGRHDIKHFYDKWGFHDIEPYEPIDVRAMGGALIPPMKFYPHAMRTRDIQWDQI